MSAGEKKFKAYFPMRVCVSIRQIATPRFRVWLSASFQLSSSVCSLRCRKEGKPCTGPQGRQDRAAPPEPTPWRAEEGRSQEPELTQWEVTPHLCAEQDPVSVPTPRAKPLGCVAQLIFPRGWVHAFPEPICFVFRLLREVPRKLFVTLLVDCCVFPMAVASRVSFIISRHLCSERLMVWA